VFLKCTEHILPPPKHSAYRHKGKWLSWFYLRVIAVPTGEIKAPSPFLILRVSHLCLFSCLLIVIFFWPLWCQISGPFHFHLLEWYYSDSITFISFLFFNASCIWHPSNSLLFIFSLFALPVHLSYFLCIPFFHPFIPVTISQCATTNKYNCYTIC
jgi:hypothetical protein